MAKGYRKIVALSGAIGILTALAWGGCFSSVYSKAKNNAIENVCSQAEALEEAYKANNGTNLSSFLNPSDFELKLQNVEPEFFSESRDLDGLSLSDNLVWSIKEVDDFKFAVVSSIPDDALTSFYCAAIGTPLLFVFFAAGTIALGLIFRKEGRNLNAAVNKLSKAAGTDLSGLDAVSDPWIMSASLNSAASYLEMKMEELKEETAKIERILNVVPSGFLAFDSHGKTILKNQAAEHFFGSEPFPTRLPERIQDAYKKALSGENDGPFDLEIHSRILSVQSIPFPLTNENGEVENGVAFTFLDVTARRHIENAKMDFFSYASHELKSPLTSIIGYQEMIRSGLITDKDEINKALDSSIAQAKEMNLMIRDMLDLSALESKRPRPTTQIDLAQIGLECINTLKPIAESKGISIITDLQPLKVMMNSQDAERLVRNLLDNAVKYNKPGGYVYLTTDPEKSELIVADTGIGMSKETAERCFERFYRSKDAKAEGTGLGLSIVKHVCNYYHFLIEVESELGKGTTFTISIPKKYLKP